MISAYHQAEGGTVFSFFDRPAAHTIIILTPVKIDPIRLRAVALSHQRRVSSIQFTVYCLLLTDHCLLSFKEVSFEKTSIIMPVPGPFYREHGAPLCGLRVCRA